MGIGLMVGFLTSEPGIPFLRERHTVKKKIRLRIMRYHCLLKRFLFIKNSIPENGLVPSWA